MNPGPIIGHCLFVDGIVRPVFLDGRGRQYVLDGDARTRVYGEWLLDDADESFVVSASGVRT
jgi:hypothetical protein